MAGKDKRTAAYAGAPRSVPQSNAFDFLFSNPFRAENDFTASSRRIPPIQESNAIFVDESSDRTLTYSRLKNDALSFAGGLHALGLDPNNVQILPPTPTCQGPEIAPVVLIQLPNCLQFATILLGTWAADLTATLVSPSLTSTELAWVLKNARPPVIITAISCLAAMTEALQLQEDKEYFSKVPVFTVDVADDPYPCLYVANDPYPSLPSSIPQSDWRRLLRLPAGQAPRSSRFDAVSRTAVILWSSGTSGKSKGVLLSHQALNFSVASLWHDADYYQGRSQRWLGYVPFYHVYGLTNVFLLSISTGFTVYTMPAFKLDAVLAAIPKRKITYLHMAPPIAVMLAKSPAVEPYARRDANGRNGFSSVVAGVTGGAPLGSDVVAQVYARLGFRIRLGYGLTEACSVSLQLGLTEQDMIRNRDDSGGPHWGVELMIADGGAASPGQPTVAAELGQPGEILIRSPGIMSGYLPFGGIQEGVVSDMTTTMEALTADGWFRTGDVGTLDQAGKLVISDRIKELIKVRGFQVAPAELEAVLCSSNEVADAGVVAIYDSSQASELPLAYVVAAGEVKSTAELGELAHRLRKLVEEKTARYKWLKGGIVFVDKIPKSPSGKILRRVLKDGNVKGLEVKLYAPRAAGPKANL